MGQGRQVRGRQGGVDFCSRARRIFRKRRGHRRYQGPHEKGVLGWINVGAQAVRLELLGYRRSDRGDRRTLKPFAQNVLAAARPCDLDEAADLTEIGQRDRIDAAGRHLVDRGDDVGVGRLRIIGLGQDGIDLGALRLDGAD